MQKTIFSLVLLLILTSLTLVDAQDYDQLTDKQFAEHPYWIEMMQDESVNFYTVQHAFETYWTDRKITKGCGWKPFKRWEYMMSSRVNPDGSRPPADLVWQEYHSYLDKYPDSKSATGNWENLGPYLIPSKGYEGLGRINALGFHPTDPKKIYIGAPSGGFWISNDYGATWRTTTDQLPSLGVSSIAVDYDDPTIIYIGTGDRDAGDAAGIGVLKSFDGGQSWELYNNGMGNAIVGRLIIHPTDPLVLWAATSNGIFKTINGGQNWENKRGGNFKELVMKPDDVDVFYACTGGSFYRSADGGESWVQINSGLPGGSRGVIAVTPANPQLVYLLLTNSSSFKGLYRSTDAGLNFTVRSTTPNIMSWGCYGGDGGQAWYDLDIAADPKYPEVLFAGGVNCFKSPDGGASWEISSHWWGDCNVPSVHADLHVLEYNPADGRLYAGNDGGIYWTADQGTSWHEISDGLAISQVYKIGQSATVRDKVINGYQDNGTSTYLGTDNWKTNVGGDGMECVVDHQDALYSYGSLYYGDIFRIVNNNQQAKIAGNGVGGITETGAWVTPFLLHEEIPTTMFAGFKNVWRAHKIKTGTPEWTKISDNLGGTNSVLMRVLEHSPADIDILYASREDKTLFRTDNANAASPRWENLTSTLPTNTTINDLEADPFDPETVYMCQGTGVYKSADKGVTWQDITGSLPGISKNDIAFYRNSQEGLYLGTDAGIYYRDAFMDDWILFSRGFPASARVTELEIYYDTVDPAEDVIRAGTYGRGLWSSDMYHAVPAADFTADQTTVPPQSTVHFQDLSSGVPTQWEWLFEGGTPATSSDRNPAVTYEIPGAYDVSLLVTNEFGTHSVTFEDYIAVDALMLPIAGFSASRTVICESETVYFTDLSQNAPIAWEWTFVPDDVAFLENTSANSSDPVVQFLASVPYSVTLEATNTVGVDIITKENYIQSGGYVAPFTADFSLGFDKQSWSVVNPDNRKTWEIVQPAWSPGDAPAAFMNFFGYNQMNQRDQLISPPLNLTDINDPYLMVDYAYTYRMALYDSLVIYVSDDCGDSWNRVFGGSGDDFITAPPQTTNFDPTGPEQWCGLITDTECISIDLSQYAGKQNVLLKFESMNKFGNNLYLANIRITSPTAIGETPGAEKIFSIHPNPTEGSFVISITDAGNYQMTILNSLGREVLSKTISGATSVDLSDQAQGLYFVKLTNGAKVWIEKVVMQ
ncbi:MAG: PKD domain-containing protein [Bacteroidales bacterium]|nr:PKD domain-containing protein [Bacteroidales bacterium]